ncbi:sushi domain-containing protein 6-like [Ambystoma mexicanum]|uniref:sushi domain-containing protein 6-like n=1 Tax=Ambystoma mexicanum TaxID=8296 RepID=UPI0037E9801C
MLGSREVHGRHCLWCISVTLALLVVLCNGASVFSKISVCPRPPAPKHGGFVCSYGCWPVLDGMQFFAGSEVEYYCDGGYTLSAPVISARCSQGKWSPVANVLCRPSPGYTDAHPPAPVPGTSISLVAAVAATVAGLLLMAMVCVLVKPKSRSCQCGQDYSRMQEPHLQSEVWHPVPLPSYEEAVYGPQGHPLSPSPLQAPLPLILAEGDLVQQNIPEGHLLETAWPSTGGCTPPPSYEEMQATAHVTSSCREAEHFFNTPPSFLLGTPADK